MHLSSFILITLVSIFLLACKSNKHEDANPSNLLTEKTKVIGFKDLDEPWKGVGYIGRYKKFCPELELRAVFIDDYNSLLVHYDKKTQRAWMNGNIEEYDQFILNGTDLIKTNYSFLHLVFYHDGKKFTTKVEKGVGDDPFQEEATDRWAYGWAMKDTDSLIISGKMQFPQADQVQFLLKYDPSNGWRLATTKATSIKPKNDVFLFAQEPIYLQLQRAFKKKDTVLVLTSRCPWSHETIKLRKPTKPEIQNFPKNKMLLSIMVKADHFLVNHEKLTDKNLLAQRLREFETISIASEEFPVIKIKIDQKSNDHLLRYLLEKITPGNADYVLLIK